MARKPANSHTQLVNSVLARLALVPGVKAWKQNTGAARIEGEGKPRFIRYGTPGQADITGIIAPGGRRLELECKTGAGRLTQGQIQFRDMILEAGGYHAVIRSMSDVEAAIRDIQEQEAGR